MLLFDRVPPKLDPAPKSELDEWLEGLLDDLYELEELEDLEKLEDLEELDDLEEWEDLDTLDLDDEELCDLGGMVLLSFVRNFFCNTIIYLLALLYKPNGNTVYSLLTKDETLKHDFPCFRVFF